MTHHELGMALCLFPELLLVRICHEPAGGRGECSTRDIGSHDARCRKNSVVVRVEESRCFCSVVAASEEALARMVVRRTTGSGPA